MKLKKAITITLSRLFRNYTYTSRHGLAKGLKRRGGLAFLPSFVPRSTEMLREEQFIQELDLAGQTVLDIGGGQGGYTLFFFCQVRKSRRGVYFLSHTTTHNHYFSKIV